MEVKQIDKQLTYDFILNKHYAQRKPSISYSFGLYDDLNLVGILTIGKPASNALCEGICGKEYSSKVYELNRLCVIDGLPKNTLSKFVSSSLKQLKKEDLILVSYADSGMNHCGYIYQATNWIYTGKTIERTDKYAENGKHSRHYNDDNNHLRIFRTAKFRYVYFTGKSKKEYLQHMNYEIIKEYPKLYCEHYILGEKQKRKVIDTNTNTIFYE